MATKKRDPYYRPGMSVSGAVSRVMTDSEDEEGSIDDSGKVKKSLKLGGHYMIRTFPTNEPGKRSLSPDKEFDTGLKNRLLRKSTEYRM